MMERTQIYLTRAEREALKKIAERRNQSQSEIIREAVDRYIDDELKGMSAAELLDKSFGIWAHRTNWPDSEELRREWDQRIESWP